jgi:RNA polymerase sigma-70 factor (ECF subfamily)
MDLALHWGAALPAAEPETPPKAKTGSSRGADDLLARLARRDEAAFAELIRHHFDRIYRIAWRVLGGAADAEDVAQEAFLKAWTAPGQIRDARAIGAWLSRVATNLALDRLRRRRPDTPGELPDLADPAAAADRGLQRTSLEAEVAAALTALPDRQRAALVLVHFEGLGNVEAAEMLGVSVEAVESLLARARRSLKLAFADRWRELVQELSDL